MSPDDQMKVINAITQVALPSRSRIAALEAARRVINDEISELTEKAFEAFDALEDHWRAVEGAPPRSLEELGFFG